MVGGAGLGRIALDLGAVLLLSPLVLVVAFLYSSVGHGGASGYLAAMSLVAVAPREMSTTALLLNVLVAGLAAWTYRRAGRLRVGLTLPFIIGSVPAAFGGGLLSLAPSTYSLALAAALLVAAVRLWPFLLQGEAPCRGDGSRSAGPFSWGWSSGCSRVWLGWVAASF